METIDFEFTGVNDTQLIAKGWIPAEKPKAILAIVHGFGEHIGRYMNAVNALVPQNIAVWGYDSRGHGESAGQRGHVNAWDEYCSDLSIFLDELRTRYPGQPIIVWGHSVGANVVLDFIVEEPRDLAGVIASGSTIEPGDVAKPILIFLANLMSRILPKFSLPLNLETAALSRIPDVVSAYENDPLVHGQASARWGTEMLASIERMKTFQGRIEIPILIIHGEEDRINLVSGTKEFFEGLDAPVKQLITYEDGYHEPHNDLNHEQVMSDIKQWIEKYI